MSPEANNNFVEQRKFLRLNASDIGRLSCAIHVDPEKTIELEPIDISPGGFGATIPDYLVNSFHKGCEFAHCQINLQGMTDISIRLAELWLLKKKDGESSMRAGFEFTSPVDWLSTGLESCIIPD